MTVYKKERYICKGCKRIKNVDEDGRCAVCNQSNIDRIEEQKIYDRQLRISMGLPVEKEILSR